MFKKNIVVTPSMMIDKAVGIVDNAVNMFKVAVQQIDEANEMLRQSQEQTQAKIQSLEQELFNHRQVHVDAGMKIQSHLELREKLNQFVQ